MTGNFDRVAKEFSRRLASAADISWDEDEEERDVDELRSVLMIEANRSKSILFDALN